MHGLSEGADHASLTGHETQRLVAVNTTVSLPAPTHPDYEFRHWTNGSTVMVQTASFTEPTALTGTWMEKDGAGGDDTGGGETGGGTETPDNPGDGDGDDSDPDTPGDNDGDNSGDSDGDGDGDDGGEDVTLPVRPGTPDDSDGDDGSGSGTGADGSTGSGSGTGRRRHGFLRR